MAIINHIEKKVNFSLNGKNANAYLPLGISIYIGTGENTEKLFKNLEAECYRKNGETYLLQHSSTIRKEFFNTQRHLFHDDDSLHNLVFSIISPYIEQLGSPIEQTSRTILEAPTTNPNKPILVIIDMTQAPNCISNIGLENLIYLFSQARAVGITILLCVSQIENLPNLIQTANIAKIHTRSKNNTLIDAIKNIIYSKNNVSYKESSMEKEKTIKL